MRVGLLLLLGTSPALTSAQAMPTDVAAIVRRASETYVLEMHGFVGMERHFTTKLRGGPFEHGEQSDSGQLFRDGKFVQIAYYRIVRDGQQLTVSQVAQRNERANKDWAAGKVFFKEPYDPRYMSEYTFEASPECSGCSAGTQGIRFDSSIRDGQHGAGVMYIDLKTGHVLKLTYIPNALPPHATSGTVTEVGGQVLPHLWHVSHITEVYQGHAFFFSGTGTFTGVFDHFRRLPTLTAGESALEDQTI